MRWSSVRLTRAFYDRFIISISSGAKVDRVLEHTFVDLVVLVQELRTKVEIAITFLSSDRR